jgi:hypothetical protein
MLEIIATLRDYIIHQYKPLYDKGNLSAEDMKELIVIDDRHLRGTRFDWESFLFQNYSKLKKDAINKIKAKGKENRRGHSTIAESIITQQVNVLICIEKWAEDMPEILIAYKLFCELVHPGLGSNFLAASIVSGKLFFTKSKGDLIGKQIFAQSFPILISSTLKPFGQYLTALLALCWREDELG